ncbi:Oca4 protein [Martiniozyma asiatica (nom. inval.)]|nr:Oca4 protein [Martiniozyma asiatica]
MLVPPDNYGMVEPGIYRCSSLSSLNIGFLATLSLRCLLWVDRERPDRQVDNYLKKQRIVVHYINNESDSDSKDQFELYGVMGARSLEVLMDVRNEDCLIVDPSGIIVGLMRKVLGWCYSSISNEYRLMVGKANYNVETYLEVMEVKLVEPEESLENITESGVGQQIPAPKQTQINQSPSSSPQIPDSLLRRSHRKKHNRARHVTLPPRHLRASWTRM